MTPKKNKRKPNKVTGSAKITLAALSVATFVGGWNLIAHLEDKTVPAQEPAPIPPTSTPFPISSAPVAPTSTPWPTVAPLPTLPPIAIQNPALPLDIQIAAPAVNIESVPAQVNSQIAPQTAPRLAPRIAPLPTLAPLLTLAPLPAMPAPPPPPPPVIWNGSAGNRSGGS